MANAAKDIPKENFTALTKLDENRARSQIAVKMNTNIDNVKNVYIWGNHSLTMVPDFSKCEINHKDIRKYKEISEDYLKSLLTVVRERGK